MIDCDVHQNFNSLRDLEQWLDPAFRDYVEVGGYGGFALPNYPWVACRARTTSCCASSSSRPDRLSSTSAFG